MQLDSGQLAAFAAVVEEGSFEAAARRLHITPSAVSQRIKALEVRTGQILVRRARPCRATPAGEPLVRLAGQIRLLEQEALARSGGLLGEQSAMPMPIAVNADSLATWFLPALADVASRYPVRFDVHQEDQDYSAELLKNGTVMAAVTADPRPVQGCRVERLGAMRYLALSSPEFRRRYFSDGVTPAALAAAPVLIFNEKDALQTRFIRSVTRRRVDPPTHVIPSSRAFVDATLLGLAWAMVPEQMASTDLGSGSPVELPGGGSLGALVTGGGSLVELVPGGGSLVELVPGGGSLVELVPGRHLDVPLYWQRWRLDSTLLDDLTEPVRKAAAQSLR